MELIIGLIYIGILIYMANVQDLSRQPSPWVSLMMGGLTLQMLYLGVGTTLFLPDAGAAFGLTAFSALLAGISFAIIYSEGFGARLARLFTYKGAALYQPDSAVHNVALVIALLTIVYHVRVFVFLGGTAGVAEALQDDTSPLLSALTSGILELFVALLGVGLFIRRNERQTLERLGLRWPTGRDVVVGLGGAVLLLIVVYAMAYGISLIVPPTTLDEQYAAVEAINAPMVASLMVAFLSALIYGMSEEILYRGALLPIFGLIPTTLLFMLVHVQYLFTPAMAIIFVVGLALGLLRQRVSTTAAIITHVAYNVLPFILIFVLGGNA